MTWSAALEAFEASLIDAERSPHTLRAYREDLETFQLWYIHQYGMEPEIGELGAAELRAWKSFLSLERKGAPSSVNRRLASLRSLSKWWSTTTGTAPAPVPRSARQVTPPPRWLTVKEQHALIRATERSKDPRTICVVKVMLHTGVRVAELATLPCAQVKIGERSGSITVVGKGRKQRTIPLNVEARGAILAYRPHWDEAPGETLVMGQRGPLKVRAIERIVEGIGELAKLPELSCHVLRHTFCRRLAEGGTRLEQIAALAGHSSLDTTRRYVEPGQEELAAAVERLAGGED